jgi:hypothetical protein
MNLHKFTVSLDEADAINSTHLANEYRDKDLGRSLHQRYVFDTADAAHDRLAELVAQGKEDGECVPGHECGRCANWPPKVYEVVITAAVVSRETR